MVAADEGPVCESCVFAVTDALISIGDTPSDDAYVAMMARASGGDIFDHECEADDDEEVDCHCGCQR